MKLLKIELIKKYLKFSCFNKKLFCSSLFTIFFCFSIAGTQALVRPGSPQSSISTDDRTSLAPSICKAKALVDSMANPYDKDALKFKVSIKNQTMKFFYKKDSFIIYKNKKNVYERN